MAIYLGKNRNISDSFKKVIENDISPHQYRNLMAIYLGKRSEYIEFKKITTPYIGIYLGEKRNISDSKNLKKDVSPHHISKFNGDLF